jgi:hypothetical protein
MQTRVHWPGFFTLFLLSPVAAELLSGAAPPAEFLSPVGLGLTVGWYGLGAILCRELHIRWRSGLAGLFLLGAAFGIAEEGILAKTFFDPQALDLGSLQSFGWWAGANWPWMLMLTLYHAVMSICLPVLAVASLWPAEGDRPWLSGRATAVFAGILVLLALMGWFFLSPAGQGPPYLPGPGQFVGAVLAVALLALPAWRLKMRPGVSALERRWPLFLAGLGWGVWLLGAWVVVDATHSTLWTMLWTGGVAAGLLAFAYPRLRALDARALIGAGTLAAGTWLFLSLLDILQALDDTTPLSERGGIAVVGLAGLVAVGAYLLYLRRQWRRPV